MLTSLPRSRSTAKLAAVGLVSSILVATSSAPAQADDHTITDPNSGASITLSSGEISAGERIQIHGEGFTAVQGSTGDPLVAIRPYDFDAGGTWTIGGEDAYDAVSAGNATAASEAKYWFVTDHTDGTFDGWIQAPASLTEAGPLNNGTHWLRILSGAFFTSSGDRLTDPITFQVPFTVTDRVTTGLTSPTGVFQAGTTFRPAAGITLRGRGFDPGTAVSVSLDSTALDSTIVTGADGRLPADARVTLPSNITLGAHSLTLTTGSESASIPITVTAAPKAEVITQRVRPGGTLAYDLSGYIGVSSQAQKVAVVVAERVLACIQTNAQGAASGIVALPSDIADSVVVGFNVGLSCALPPTGVVNDQPISRIAPTIGVSSTAPTVAVAGTTYAGGSVTVAGRGFAPQRTVRITVGTTDVGILTSSADGSVSGSVPAPAAPGEHRLLATDGTDTAATGLTLAPKRTSTLSLTAPTPRTYGAARSTTVRLARDGTASAGTVVIRQGTWQRTLTVSTAGTRVSLPRTTPVGAHAVTASFAGDSTSSAAQTSRRFSVTKASTSVTLKLAKAKVERKARPTARVRVVVRGAPAGSRPTGRVVVYDGKRRLVTRTLRAGHRGVLTVKLPRMKKAGLHRLRVVYSGGPIASSGRSGIVRLTVKR